MINVAAAFRRESLLPVVLQLLVAPLRFDHWDQGNAPNSFVKATFHVIVRKLSFGKVSECSTPWLHNIFVDSIGMTPPALSLVHGSAQSGVVLLDLFRSLPCSSLVDRLTGIRPHWHRHLPATATASVTGCSRVVCRGD